MVMLNDEILHASIETTESNHVILTFRDDIKSGTHWYIALLNAIGRWEIPEETHNQRLYRYLIADEAFDCMVLTERLCDAAGDLIPENETLELLFYNNPPVELTTDEFKRHIGDLKYHWHLNYYYGITVEEALQYAVEDEIRKERRGSGLYRDKDNTGEAFHRIYGFNRTVMLKRFRKEKSYPQLKSIKLNEMKEFTYWLFKFRLKQSDKARVASDTRKGIDWLQSLNTARQSAHQDRNKFDTGVLDG
jgi:hypothetical protein